jgi:hypothetical protein
MARGGANTNGSKLKQAARRAREAAVAHQAKVDMVRVKATQRQAERDQQELAEMMQGIAQARDEKKIDEEAREDQKAAKTTKVSIEDEIAAINTKLKAVFIIQRAVRHRRSRAAAATAEAHIASERFMWAALAQEHSSGAGGALLHDSESMVTEESSTESSQVSATHTHGTEASGQFGSTEVTNGSAA